MQSKISDLVQTQVGRLSNEPAARAKHPVEFMETPPLWRPLKAEVGKSKPNMLVRPFIALPRVEPLKSWPAEKVPPSLVGGTSSNSNRPGGRATPPQRDVDDDEGEEEQFGAEDSGGEEGAPGIDANDFDDADLFGGMNRGPSGNQSRGMRPDLAPKPKEPDMGLRSSAEYLLASVPESNAPVSQEYDEGIQRSKLTKSQREKQSAERPRWSSDHNHSENEEYERPPPRRHSGEVEIQSSDNEDALSDEEPDDRDITIRREKDQRYPTLKIQSPRVKAVLHRSFVLARGRLCFHSAYAPAEDPNRFFRQILREAARDLRDSELAQVLKTNAAYGNALAHLVKARYTKSRLEIAEEAQVQARMAYRLSEKRDLKKRVEGLLSEDTFIYNVDESGRALATEPYRHPAIVAVLQSFFRDSKCIGQIFSTSFTSSIQEDDDVRSWEPEIPIPMLALSVAMLHAEISLWKYGRREMVKFDADSHFTAYDHHVKFLENLRNKYLPKYHRLMAYLYTQARDADSAGDGPNEDTGVLKSLDLDGMAE
ncbi:hypothetical protein FA13DRAFT_1774501 [Coprinellus micaceus]|uniref:DUF6532 domain-containing protein n=1 Tax=Coprinellus micaceus TaxID=71717 RepID=A0A4Y7TAC3_COPMI|nr:hypothetical protein FA13DRAFT_1774501 [Coprinellus micaceus]